MSEAKRTILPADPDDLICDTCPERFAYTGDLYTTFERARVRGWHIFQRVEMNLDKVTGFMVGNTVVETRILCPDCIGTARSKLPPPPEVLEGQADILEELDVSVQHTEKEKKPRKGGRAVN